jgi:ABC-type nitrate/sulfonate/bicarbonate transport system substrate-binding protein
MKKFSLGLIGAFAAISMTTSANAQQVVVGAASNVGGMEIFVAQAKGFFAKHGLDSKVVVRNTGSALTKSLKAGQIDFAPAAFTNLPVALERGFKVNGVVGYLGGMYQNSTHDTNVGIIARPGSGIKTIKDMKGRKIGVAFGTTGDLYFRTLLRNNGLSKNDVKRINVRPPSHVSVLDTDGVDAVVAWEPNVTRALEKVKGSRLVVRGGGHVCFCALIHGIPSKVYGDKKRTQALVDAISEAAAFLRDPANLDSVAQIGSQFVRGMTPALIKKTLKHVTFDPRIGPKTADAFNFSVKQLIAQKKMKRPFDANKYLEFQFINSTMKRHPEWFADLK